MKKLLFFFVFFPVVLSASNGEIPENIVLITEQRNDTMIIRLEPATSQTAQVDQAEWKGKKRFVSAMLAFPFPFGFIGAHRVMLGCKPWVPVVYVATFGGCFGLLPLIDFCVIVFSKDLEQYENNPDIFMWVK